MKLRIAINGFGRIGRNFLRVVLADAYAREKLDIVAINIGPSDPAMLAHLFKYDTLMGTFSGDVSYGQGTLIINGMHVAIVAERDPQRISWGQFSIDWVVDASGKFTYREGAQFHLNAGARYVLITAPAKDEDITIIPGVNAHEYNPNIHRIVSLGSCTTNAVVPMLKVLHEAFQIVTGFMTTVHAYTNDQVLLDVAHKDPRRARAAALNIVPTTTGAMKVLDKVYPPLAGKIGGSALRVPVGKGSLVDITVMVTTPCSRDVINEAFLKAAQNKDLRSIVGVSSEPLVSSDYDGIEYSVVIDTLLTDVRGMCIKVFGWYDNEWGYSVRLKDFLMSVAS
ncbi:type I glyceraldehyde-3-phosphate dehydrogenase [Candidatus Dependentiae bacterium]|nr:type I glyceraldehyde-3-phosphate dehydrogenase [Candidatus Dependentiae bacterium]